MFKEQWHCIQKMIDEERDCMDIHLISRCSL